MQIETLVSEQLPPSVINQTSVGLPSPRIAVILIATGGSCYTQYVEPLVRSLNKFFPPHTVILYTDDHTYYENNEGFPLSTRFIQQPNLGWPRATLMRYHAILRNAWWLNKYDYLYYMDVDQLVVDKIQEYEICGPGLTAVIHPCYPDAFERRESSTAYVRGEHTYYQGCFIGGATNSFLVMCEQITNNIDIDDEKGILALWHDESHLNRYLIDHPPVISLPPTFAWPAEHYLRYSNCWTEEQIREAKPKILHLEKVNQGSWKN